METPFTDPVRFTLSVLTTFEGDHWVAHSLETGTHTYGESEDEALLLNAEANQLVVAELKNRGETQLREYFQALSIDYAIGHAPPLRETSRSPKLTAVTCAA